MLPLAEMVKTAAQMREFGLYATMPPPTVHPVEGHHLVDTRFHQVLELGPVR